MGMGMVVGISEGDSLKLSRKSLYGVVGSVVVWLGYNASPLAILFLFLSLLFF